MKGIIIRDIQTIETAPQGINLLIVKVLTNEPELTGYGCATFSYRQLAVKKVIETYLKPLLTGRDAGEIESLWQLMEQNAYWRSGPIEHCAISGIDMALWDILGKYAKLPLYQLLGGACRTGVQIYQHADGATLPQVLKNVEKLAEKGLRYIRCQMGGYGGGGYGKAPVSAPHGSSDGVYTDASRYMCDTLKMFEGLKEHFADLHFCHDVHGRLSPAQAMAFARKLEPFELFFLEDPVTTENLDWLMQLRAHTSVPLAQGELFNHPGHWMNCVQNRYIDYIRAHIAQLGGITPARKLQAFCELHGVRIAWHAPGDQSALGHAAAIHFDMSSPNFGIQEWSGTEPPNGILQKISIDPAAYEAVFPVMPRYENGYVYPSDLPGLGVMVDEEAARRYPCTHDTTLWTQTRQVDGSHIYP